MDSLLIEGLKLKSKSSKDFMLGILDMVILLFRFLCFLASTSLCKRSITHAKERFCFDSLTTSHSSKHGLDILVSFEYKNHR